MSFIIWILVFTQVSTIVAFIAFYGYTKKQKDQTQEQLPFQMPTIIIGMVSEFTKDDSSQLRGYPDALKLLSKLIDYRIAYYAENFRHIEATDNDLRIYQWYINALIALRWQIQNLLKEKKE